MNQNSKNDIYKKNVELLFEGYWYADLPPIFDIDDFKEVLYDVIIKIADGNYSDQFSTEENFIVGFKGMTPPSYIYNEGIEPIIFYDFKKNGALREMQLQNIKFYCAFVYNTMQAYESLFLQLYSGENVYDKYVRHSNSYLIIEKMFSIRRDYADYEEEVRAGEFAVSNNKLTGQHTYDENSIRYLESQGSKLFTTKIDIESFFPNIYTHSLTNLSKCHPFIMIRNCEKYFSFLDYYNMKINNNQTKGIAAGVFSSTLCAELLMLSIDFEIKEIIGEEVEYVRYVDDLSFFSDSYEVISTKIPLVQKLLNKYRLRINNDKTEKHQSIYDIAYVDFRKLRSLYPFFNQDANAKVFDRDVFFNIKNYIAELIQAKKISEVKAFLTMLKTSLADKRLFFDNNSDICFEKYLVFYMLQLICVEPLLASRGYKLIIEILEQSSNKHFYDEICNTLKDKCKYINENYSDSLVQIWHYYVISKYDKNSNFSSIKNEFDDADTEINPIIVSAFIKDSHHGNKEVFNYIKQRYTHIENKDGEPGIWKNSIMLSKWWFPIFLIYIKDGYNYHELYSANFFHSLYKDMKYQVE